MSHLDFENKVFDNLKHVILENINSINNYIINNKENFLLNLRNISHDNNDIKELFNNDEYIKNLRIVIGGGGCFEYYFNINRCILC